MTPITTWGHACVRFERDGRRLVIAPGVFSNLIPPGHDGWVEGEEPFVGVEVMSAEQFAKSSPVTRRASVRPCRTPPSGVCVNVGELR